MPLSVFHKVRKLDYASEEHATSLANRLPGDLPAAVRDPLAAVSCDTDILSRDAPVVRCTDQPLAVLADVIDRGRSRLLLEIIMRIGDVVQKPASPVQLDFRTQRQHRVQNLPRQGLEHTPGGNEIVAGINHSNRPFSPKGVYSLPGVFVSITFGRRRMANLLTGA